MLDERLRSVFARFAVFAGGATLDAAEAVTGAGIDAEIEALVPKALLIVAPNPMVPLVS